MITRINTEGLHKDSMETFFVEQADGTWHKMSLPDGVERNIKNAVFEGRFRKIDIPKGKLKEYDKREDIEFFVSKGEHGIPNWNWVEKIPD